MEAVLGRIGFVPNLQAVMAHSAAALNLYATGNELLSSSSLTAQERSVVFLVVSRINDCGYCVAAHSVGARLPQSVIDDIRDGRLIEGAPRLAALQYFVGQMVEHRGKVAESVVRDFIAAGYTLPQVLEIISAIALKTLTNYAARFFDVELDSAFSPQAGSANRTSPGIS